VSVRESVQKRVLLALLMYKYIELRANSYSSQH